MKAFYEVGTAIGGCNFFASDGIQLQLPTILTANFDDAFARPYVQAIDVLPRFYVCIFIGHRCFQDLGPTGAGKIGFGVSGLRFGGGWLNPRELLFNLQQQTADNHQQQWQCNQYRAPSMQLADPPFVRTIFHDSVGFDCWAGWNRFHK